MNNFLLSDDIDLNSLLQNYNPFLALFVILVISIVADKGLSVFEKVWHTLSDRIWRFLYYF